MDEKKVKSLKISILIILLLVVSFLLIMVLLEKRGKGGVELIKEGLDLTIDGDSETGGFNTTDLEKVQDDLNKKVSDGMINISMNTNPIFKDSESKGNLFIVNEEVNKYPQMVEIYRDSDNQLIYKSGLIPVGSKIENAKLDVILEKGKYKCTAYFSAINIDTEEIVGKAGARIEISILN